MSAQQRLDAVAGHLNSSGAATPSPALKKLLEKNPDDIVITASVRTPLTKARKGGLKDTPAEELIVHVLKAIKDRSGIDPNVVEDVCIGNVLQPAPGFVARSAVLAAGFPVGTAANVASRFCSSGLLSIQTVASSIAIGAIDVGIAVGCESMSTNDDKPPPMSPIITEHPIAKDNLQPMGWTSENVARDFNITRQQQDKLAEMSHNRAERSQKEGWTADEIAPITTQWIDPKTKEKKTVTLDRDDGIRPGTTYEGLSKIRSAFPHWGPTTTGGNASQVTDGAAAVLLMKRSTAQKLGQKIIGKYVLSTVVGLEPRIMGIGPSLAIPKVLEKTGLTKDDVDLFEINEAFASMYVYCVNELGLDINKVNVRGGAIAIGHPLGCTGTRQVVTVLSELRRRKAKVAVTSMCVGTGMGMAGVFVNEA
ncbi:acetyl-CoA acyltransferase [Exophiala aquamarina CBS 119918]|uniref:acetyl-CoA C-acyltransferase n=1 Tax=Exophiala aquamarina CBS 119918 TaxID=1182545 RepID=A0A072PDH0_9EURO|nr:acetyl-CoA acyltransferase [Exophiala aquamarina CBS 119918]KEF57911.1 acetyl-CoA acyltransferase [Exophiala aquamarina CBS 119918]